MAVTTIPRPNLGSSGLIEIIDGIEFEGFGSGGFDEDDLLITGDEVDNVIAGGIGHDQIEGNGGNDIITGGDGNDTIGGGEGDDDIDGQGGTNKLFGDAGNDILRVGSGHDRMTGGEGNDIFGFYGAGHFEIRDFTIGEDQIFFDSTKLGINSLEQLVSFITNVEQNEDSVRVEFVDDAASITLVGINLDDITAEMIGFA
ncbi:MAG: hemolysin expression modulating protein [Nitrosomonas sp.]|nr:hemolysin expression modulating protein [Nitrosomonas sp.]